MKIRVKLPTIKMFIVSLDGWGRFSGSRQIPVFAQEGDFTHVWRLLGTHLQLPMAESAQTWGKDPPAPPPPHKRMTLTVWCPCFWDNNLSIPYLPDTKVGVFLKRSK